MSIDECAICVITTLMSFYVDRLGRFEKSIEDQKRALEIRLREAVPATSRDRFTSENLKITQIIVDSNYAPSFIHTLR